MTNLINSNPDLIENFDIYQMRLKEIKKYQKSQNISIVLIEFHFFNISIDFFDLLINIKVIIFNLLFNNWSNSIEKDQKEIKDDIKSKSRIQFCL